MPPQEPFSNSNPPEPTTRLEPPIMNQPPPADMPMERPAVPLEPTIEIKPPIMPPPQPATRIEPVMTPPHPPFLSAPSPSAAHASRGPLFWSLVGGVVTIVLVGVGFYLYGMFLSGNIPVVAPETLQPAVRECGSDAPCLASAILLCAPAHGTVSIDDPLSFVVARSVIDITVNGTKSDVSCGVIITQNSSSAALPDSFFEAAKIPEAERGAVNEQFAKDNVEPNALLDALTGLDALCSFSSDGANALGTFITRSREIEYNTSVDTTVGTATPITIAKIGGVPVDIDFWRECLGELAVNRSKALEDAVPLIKVK